MAGKIAVALRQFTKGKPKTAGRNSQGRITSFHRGGGAKRLLRTIDLKRNTPGVGIVERIEYDPNRSSNIALVRWIEGTSSLTGRQNNSGSPSPVPQKETLDSALTASDGGKFSFSTLPGGSAQKSFGGIITSAFSNRKSPEGLKSLPRAFLAGSKPYFFASRQKADSSKEEFPLSEIKEWRPDSQIWIHRMKRKAAISWQSLAKS